jgi:hypothetical protein
MKSRKSQFLIYRWANIAVGIICLGLLLLGKSEPQNQLIFGYSLRIILLAVLMLAFTVGFFIVTQPRANLFRKEELKPVDASLPAPETRLKHGWVWLAILALAGLGAFLALLFIPLSTNSEFTRPLIRIIPFLVFGLFFSLSTLLYLGLGSMRDQFLDLIKQLRKLFQIPLELFFFEIIYLTIVSVVFSKLIAAINVWDGRNGNSFIIITFWGLAAISGLAVFSRARNFQASISLQNIRIKNGHLYGMFALIVVLIFTVGHPVFGANDDYAMMSIASGLIDGNPDAHLMFTNILIGTVLKFLYSFTTSVDWYGLYLILVLVVSAFALLKILIDLFRGTISRPIALLIFFIFIPRLILSFNFTSVAIIACFTGISLLARSTFPGQAAVKPGETILGVALIVISGLIRYQAMALVGLFAAPSLLFLILKKRNWKLVVPIGISLVLAVGAYFYDIQAYKASPEWSDFREYNDQRGMIHDTPKLNYDPSQRPFWNQIGWQESGYELFHQWFYIDNQVFTLDSLKAVNQEFRYAVNTPNAVFERFSVLFRKYQAEELSLLVALAVVFLFLPVGNKRTRIYLGLLVVYLLGIIIGLAFVQRIPDHIYLPTLFVFSLYILAVGRFLSGTEMKIEKRNLPLSLLQIVLVGALLLQTGAVLRLDQSNAMNIQTREYLFAAVSDEVEASLHPLVVFHASSVPDSWVAPFAEVDVPFDYVQTGWLTNSPPYNHVLKRHGIDNLIDASYSNPNVYFLGNVQDAVLNYVWHVKHIDARIDRSVPIYFSIVSLETYSKVDLTRFVRANPPDR